MKNKIIFIILFFLFFFSNLIQISADQFKYLSDEIKIIDNGNIIEGRSNIKIEIEDKFIILADRFKYQKNLEQLEIIGNIKFKDKFNNIDATGTKIIYFENSKIIEIIDQVNLIDNKNKIDISSNKLILNIEKNLLEFRDETKVYDKANKFQATASKLFYSKNSNKIYSDNETKINYNNFDISLNNFEYEINKKISSKNLTVVKDNFGNQFKINGFVLEPQLNQFLGKEITFLDQENNKYFLKDAMINTENKNIYGRDLDIKFNKLIFNNNKNDPRINARVIKIKENSTIIKKGVFTSCSEEHECPPWSIYANEIEHDKNNQVIKSKLWLNI